jgi:uncharacterized protein (TIGR03435 family)
MMPIRSLFASVIFLARLMAQAPPAGLRFEVASVKVAQSPIEMLRAGKGMPSGTPVFSGTRVEIGSMAMRNLLATAYNQDIRRIVAPAWATDTNFSIQAVMPEGATKDQFPAMLRALLEERFHLVARLATSDQTAYALTVAKGGNKMKAGTTEVNRSGCDMWRDAPAFPGAKTCSSSQTAEDGSRIGLNISTDSKFGPTRTETSRRQNDVEYYAITMPQLAEALTNTLGSGPKAGIYAAGFAQVVDHTELDGKWHLTVERVFTDNALSAADGPVQSIPITPTLIANELIAGLSKMGLKMEKTTAPVEMLVVEKLDQTPTEN